MSCLISSTRYAQMDLRSKTQMQCPLCHSVKTRRTEKIAVEPIIALWQESFQIDIRPELHHVSEIELWSCSDCCVLFFKPECLAGSAEMYAQLEGTNGYYPARKWEYDAALADLRGRQRVLEIGCGSGNF